jgi:zinc D-Ala-D-Ala dipeptidase
MNIFQLDPNNPLPIDPYSPYGFRYIVEDTQDSALWVLEKSLPWVDIKELIPWIWVDLKYATEDNVSWVPQYDINMKALLRKEVATMLSVSQQFLKSLRWKEYSLLVYDAGRPQSVQESMYDWCQKNEMPNLFANPTRGSMHTFGCAVDVTITKNWVPLDMGTKFDDPSEKAMPKYEGLLLASWNLSLEVIDNRELLRQVMEEWWFSNIDIEWWHFETPDDEDDLWRRANIRKDLPRLYL